MERDYAALMPIDLGALSMKYEPWMGNLMTIRILFILRITLCSLEGLLTAWKRGVLAKRL